MKYSNTELAWEIGKIIRHHRLIKKGLTLEQFGELANLDGNNIGRYERGEKLPNLISFLKIFATLEINLNDYLPLLKEIIDREE